MPHSVLLIANILIYLVIYIAISALVLKWFKYKPTFKQALFSAGITYSISIICCIGLIYFLKTIDLKEYFWIYTIILKSIIDYLILWFLEKKYLKWNLIAAIFINHIISFIILMAFLLVVVSK